MDPRAEKEPGLPGWISEGNAGDSTDSSAAMSSPKAGDLKNGEEKMPSEKKDKTLDFNNHDITFGFVLKKMTWWLQY